MLKAIKRVPNKQNDATSRQSQHGITLLEVLIGLAIVGILVTSVGPNVRQILIHNQVIAQINELSAVIQFARHTAVNEQISTIVCPTTNFSSCSVNWDNPKMVFADIDGNGARADSEEIVAGAGNIVDTLDLAGPNGAITFLPSGAASGAATLLLCHEDNEAKFARELSISLHGRVKLSQDSNSDGIHEGSSGAALTCS